jgi:hypothetical protein
MVIFNSYVKLPEGNFHPSIEVLRNTFMELVEDGSPIGGFLDLRGPSTGKKNTTHLGREWKFLGNIWDTYI